MLIKHLSLVSKRNRQSGLYRKGKNQDYLTNEEPTVAVLLATSFYKSDKSITRREVKQIRIVEGKD